MKYVSCTVYFVTLGHPLYNREYFSFLELITLIVTTMAPLHSPTRSCARLYPLLSQLQGAVCSFPSPSSAVTLTSLVGLPGLFALIPDMPSLVSSYTNSPCTSPFTNHFAPLVPTPDLTLFFFSVQTCYHFT